MGTQIQCFDEAQDLILFEAMLSEGEENEVFHNLSAVENFGKPQNMPSTLKAKPKGNMHMKMVNGKPNKVGKPNRRLRTPKTSKRK